MTTQGQNTMNNATCAGCSTVRECLRIGTECPNVTLASESQHARDSAELRSLCQARDDARRERDLLAVEVAAQESNVGHLSQLVDDLRDQLAAVGAGGVSGRLMGGAADTSQMLADALRMFVGTDALQSLCRHESVDVFGRVKGTWGAAAEANARAALSIFAAAPLPPATHPAVSDEELQAALDAGGPQWAAASKEFKGKVRDILAVFSAKRAALPPTAQPADHIPDAGKMVGTAQPAELKQKHHNATALKLAEKELARLVEENFGRMPRDTWADCVLNMRDALITTQPQQSTPAVQQSAVMPEFEGIAAEVAKGSGFWRSCSGCHETNEGHSTGPYSDIFNCALGVGCSECGGIGAVWDNTDYEAIAIAITEQSDPDGFFESKLKAVLEIVNRYLPPDGTSVQQAMNEIISVVDPWPVQSAAINPTGGTT